MSTLTEAAERARELGLSDNDAEALLDLIFTLQTQAASAELRAARYRARLEEVQAEAESRMDGWDGENVCPWSKLYEEVTRELEQ